MLSVGYATEKWWLPGARVGLRKNLAGSELSYLGAGITFLKFLNLDVAATLDTTEISGSTLPRGLIINLGTQFSF